MELINIALLEECKKKHPYLTSRIDRFINIVESHQWVNPQDVKNAFGRHADQVKGYWIIDIGGKKGARVLMAIQFKKAEVQVYQIWTDHDEYMRWSGK